MVSRAKLPAFYAGRFLTGSFMCLSIFRCHGYRKELEDKDKEDEGKRKRTRTRKRRPKRMFPKPKSPKLRVENLKAMAFLN